MAWTLTQGCYWPGHLPDTWLTMAWTLTQGCYWPGHWYQTLGWQWLGHWHKAAIGLDTYQTLDWQWLEHWHKIQGCYWSGHLPDTWLTMAWTLTPDTRLHRPGHWYQTLGWQWLGHWHKAAIGRDTYKTLDWQWLEHWHKIQGCYWSGHLQDTWLTMAWTLTQDTRLLLVGTLTRHLTDNGLNTNTRYKAA